LCTPTECDHALWGASFKSNCRVIYVLNQVQHHEYVWGSGQVHDSAPLLPGQSSQYSLDGRPG